MKEFIAISKIGLEIINSNQLSDHKIHDYFLADNVSDGYHTFSELYNHRYALFYALVKVYDNYITPIGSIIQCWKSKLHDDGTMFDDSFIVGMTIKHTDWNGIIKREYITYHYPLSWWDKFKIMELQKAPEWDGHTSDDVIERLMGL